MDETQFLIEVKKLRFSYDSFQLDIDSLSFPAGKITAIIGPNGAGKTTLLKCLAGLLPIEKKTIFYDSQDIARLKEPARARIIGYVPQEHSLAFNYSVLEFVVMGRAAHLSLFSLPSSRDFESAHQALEFVGLSSFASRPLSELSSGERRLVLIARSLAQETPVLLLDEPTTFLDIRHGLEILGLVRRLAGQKGKTIVLTLHDINQAAQFADNLVMIKQGKVVASGDPFRVLTEELLEDVYGVKVSLLDLSGRRFIVIHS
ncbi:MAG: ABC transporter ATP-binding protein [Candidatus Aminicenantes bacterium]|nr:ABC transporter ATP-binding protein [Candidatus Aminicenantes bacterium]